VPQDIPEAILAFDIQNEGHMNTVNPSWICDRATALRPRLSGNGILIGTGGGTDVGDSVIDQHFACGAIDVVGVHSYDAGAWASRLGGIVSKARASGKRIIVEEFGQQGGDRASSLARQIADIRSFGVPWMVWQVTKPNLPDDFEVWATDGAAWPVLSSNGQQSLSAGGAFAWPEIFPSSGWVGRRRQVPRPPRTYAGAGAPLSRPPAPEP
jgi:mannan endo-1,4-beta-mannosidase